MLADHSLLEIIALPLLGLDILHFSRLLLCQTPGFLSFSCFSKLLLLHLLQKVLLRLALHRLQLLSICLLLLLHCSLLGRALLRCFGLHVIGLALHCHCPHSSILLNRLSLGSLLLGCFPPVLFTLGPQLLVGLYPLLLLKGLAICQLLPLHRSLGGLLEGLLNLVTASFHPNLSLLLLQEGVSIKAVHQCFPLLLLLLLFLLPPCTDDSQLAVSFLLRRFNLLKTFYCPLLYPAVPVVQVLLLQLEVPLLFRFGAVLLQLFIGNLLVQILPQSLLQLKVSLLCSLVVLLVQLCCDFVQDRPLEAR
mmetsp:Transcript_120171/g.285538  ORF Transcript_120171/g.285538 Transcript_120171/m.285538 type:complete len:306 (-) Transcript_120171:609-1526(-)